MKYSELKQELSEQFNNFEGVFFAFNEKQLEEGLNKLNCTRSDVVQLSCGGIILKTQVQAYKDMLKEQEQRLKDYLKEPTQLLNALIYELRNHEYGYTYDYTDAIAALDLNVEDIDLAILEEACNIASQLE